MVLERKLLHDLMVVGVGGQLFLVEVQAGYYHWETDTEAVQCSLGGGVGKVDTADDGSVVVGHKGVVVEAY